MEVDLIMNHTNYTRDEAVAMLAEHKDPLLVIRKYMAPPKKVEAPPLDAAQLIRHTIHKFMEEAFEKR
jgi:hypothetical protein